MIKPPNAIAPAVTTASRFLFIVGLFYCLAALLRAFERHDRTQAAAVTNFFRHWATLAAKNTKATGAWHEHLHTRSCNQSAATTVMCIGVDALSITWMILTQAPWLMLRFKTMMKQRVSWCDGFIRWWLGSSA